jgi:uncharacterized protein (TIGR02466 family)
MNDDTASARQQETQKSSEMQSAAPTADMLFPSLVFHYQVPGSRAMNATFLRFILEERLADPTGLQLSNVGVLGGWHSRNSLYREPVFKPLVDAIATVAQTIARRLDYDPKLKFTLDQMWAVVNPPGAYNNEHLHPHALWSGAYYVQVPENAGRLRFVDPRPGNVMLCAQHRQGAEQPEEAKLAIAHEPLEGNLVMFPGYLPHLVEPNLSRLDGEAGLRIAISFNLAQH